MIAAKLEDYTYSHGLDEKLFRTLNKDKGINQFFGIRYVGECMKTINDFYFNSEDRTHKGWEAWYKQKIGFDKLMYVSHRCNIKLPDLPYEDLKRYTYFRVIGQTWNGFSRELSIIEELKEHFNCEIRKTTFDIDHNYCIDAELVENDMILLGIQIKPISYKKMNTTYQLKAKENHKKKNDEYAKLYAPYLYVFYDNGEIANKQETINKINTIIHLNI